jgi:hypothetical protein
MVKNIREVYTIYKKYTEVLKVFNSRRPNFPESVSEELIRTILVKRGDSSVRKYKGTDLMSDIEGKQECKCFTNSKSPLSFGPTQTWSVLYILDATLLSQDKFKLYRIGMDSDSFGKTKVSNTQTYLEQCLQNRRPKLSWNSIYKQVPKKKISLIFDGVFDDIV